MTYRANIYLQRPGSFRGQPCGEKDIATYPSRAARISFEHRGKLETGHIELIAPEDWEKIGTTPTVLVVQDDDQPAPSPPSFASLAPKQS